MYFSPAVAQRQDGRLILVLSKKYPAPPIPYELEEYISHDDWVIRVTALTNLAARYYRPVFERIWLCLALITTLVVPVVLYRPILMSIYKSGETQAAQITVARIISLLIFVATLLVFWAPIFIWKMIGHHRACALLASYSRSDEARSATNNFIPKWKVTLPGVFSTHTILTITAPPAPPYTSFHPDAYLPAYISKAEAAQGAYFYPYPAASREAGLPRMSVIGGYGAQEKV